MIRPITPDEAGIKKIPDEVIKVFNKLIKENFIHKSAKVYQDEVVDAIVDEMKIPRQEIFDKHYLDIESIYNIYWVVNYYKPAYNDIDKAYFEFRKRTNDEN